MLVALLGWGAVILVPSVAHAQSEFPWEEGSNGNIYYDEGNVGIGTSAPGERLNVLGKIHLGDGGELPSWVHLGITNVGNPKIYLNSNGGTGATSALVLRNEDTDHGFAVGLQKLSPSNSRVHFRHGKGGYWHDQIQMQPDLSLHFQRQKSAVSPYDWGGIEFHTDTQFHAKVGIGTTSPDYKLDINTPLSDGFSVGKGGDSGRIWTDYSDYSPSLIFYDYDDRGGIIRFRESPDTGDEENPEHETILVGWRGNIGINTLKPKERFAVDGKVKAKEVIVETGWSDFVFEKGYDLPTLDEVKVHIEERGHLLDIPSAEEVERDGVRLGQMDAKLLQKIEELTLYAIERQEQAEVQQGRITELEVRNATQQEQIEHQRQRIDRLERFVRAMREEAR